MNGKILEYNNEYKSGLIRGEDGNKYRFSIDDCKSEIKPRVNAEVDFEPSGDKAIEIYVLTKDTVDDIKDIASSAVKATVTVARAASEKTKAKPKIITLMIIGLIGWSIWYVIAIYLPEKKEHQKEQDIEQQRIALIAEGDQLLKSGNYANAITRYESAKALDSDRYHQSFRQCINDNIDRPCGIIEQYDFKIAEAYIGLNNPDKVMQLLGDPQPEIPYDNKKAIIYQLYSHKTCNDVRGCYLANDKAYFCILASKAYKLKGDKASAENYARLACDHGNCSLVEK